jgi:hypothetical protein
MSDGRALGIWPGALHRKTMSTVAQIPSFKAAFVRFALSLMLTISLMLALASV